MSVHPVLLLPWVEPPHWEHCEHFFRRIVERTMMHPAMALQARTRRRALARELQYFVRRPSVTQLDHDELGASDEAPLHLALSDEERRHAYAILHTMEQAIWHAQSRHPKHAPTHA